MAITVEGFVIVSADGLLTDASHQQPDALRFKGDHRFFVDGLKRAALVVHGRNSGDGDPRKQVRRRLIVTRKVERIEPAGDIPQSFHWNPAGIAFEAAAKMAGVTEGAAAIIGGPEVYSLFLDRYDIFWLSEAPRVQLRDGDLAFKDAAGRHPRDVLGAHGLEPGEPLTLDAEQDVTVTPWRRLRQTS